MYGNTEKRIINRLNAYYQSYVVYASKGEIVQWEVEPTAITCISMLTVTCSDGQTDRQTPRHMYVHAHKRL